MFVSVIILLHITYCISFIINPRLNYKTQLYLSNEEIENYKKHIQPLLDLSNKNESDPRIIPLLKLTEKKTKS